VFALSLIPAGFWLFTTRRIIAITGTGNMPRIYEKAGSTDLSKPIDR
jgi:hypothetical protein